ncbi:MAG: CopD family protein, partial [Sulfurimonas sp.]|nr:CopD family protein [Sulfurimonas sp.]
VVKVMEMKIYKYIGVPAMWATVLSGSYLAFELGFDGGWLHAKIFFVLVLMAYFYSLGYFREKFLKDDCHKSGKFFRMYNEVPTLLLMVIVAMVILKPF